MVNAHPCFVVDIIQESDPIITLLCVARISSLRVSPEHYSLQAPHIILYSLKSCFHDHHLVLLEIEPEVLTNINLPKVVVMTSSSDPEMEYLSASFDPSSLTVPKLRGILMSHDIPYPASAKKPQLIDIFTQQLIPKSRRILAARSRTRRTSKGITDIPSSQEGTVNGDEDDNVSLMPPPPTPGRGKRREKSANDDTESSSRRRVSSGRKSSTKHARPSDTETDPELEPKRPLVRKTRKSEVTPTVKVEDADDRPVRPSLNESPFSHENPFQSGSSPLLPGESRRRSAGTSVDRGKSTSRRRKTEGVSSSEVSRIKQEDGVVVPTSKTFEVPVAKLKRPKPEAQVEQDDGVEAGEDFTPEEQLELVRARAANGDLDILPPRKKKRIQKSSSVPRSAPWVVIMTLLSGYALWFRQEKLQVGYCGIGRSPDALSNMKIPEWASALQPTCEPCPQHAYCYEGMETRCEQDFVLKPHPLSLGPLIPLPPTCEPDGEKVRRVKAVADRAVEELRERKAKFECGTLTDSRGKDTPTLDISSETLRTEVSEKRRKGMSSAEFEDLWKGAIGEILGREEVIHSVEG